MSIANAHTAMQDGDLTSALEMLQHRLEAMPDDVQTIQLLIRCHLQRNELREAGDRLQKLLRQPSQDATTYVLTGDLYSRTGQIQQAAQAYREALRLQPDAIEALHGISLTLIGLQKLDQAREYLQQALAVAADHPDTRRNLGLLHRCMAPRWHFPMVNDIRRNDLFERAIKKVVNEHSHVLDIGAGSGLLSLMAARAGSKHIHACESNPFLADIATRVIANNDLADVITVHACASQSLQIGKHMPQRADVILAEVFDSAVIGEGAIATYAHALSVLAQPDCITIPCRAELRGVMVASEALWHQGAVAEVNGFDLRALNDIDPGMIGLDADRLPMRAVSDTVTLMTFDFSMHGKTTALRQDSTLIANQASQVHAIVYWMKLWLDDEIYLDNRPDLGDGNSVGFIEHWGPMAKIINPIMTVEPGTKLQLQTHHDRMHVTVVVCDPASGAVLA